MLRDAGVNLQAFTRFPEGRRVQLDFVPVDAASFLAAAKAAKVKLSRPKKTFLISGDDRPGAMSSDRQFVRAGSPVCNPVLTM